MPQLQFLQHSTDVRLSKWHSILHWFIYNEMKVSTSFQLIYFEESGSQCCHLLATLVEFQHWNDE